MRKNIVAGNWKMNTTVPEGVKLAKEVNDAVAAAGDLKCDVVIGVPFTHLTAVKAVIDINKVGLAAENCADHTSGAYTGEVSAPMVASTGANYVILGHSERRGYYGETYEILKNKVDLALESGLKIIFCCGESLEERENGSFKEVIKAELADSLFHLSAEAFANIVIAYEPIWAIGTGKTATSDQAQEVHAFIRGLVARSMASRWPTTPPSSTAAAASPPTLPSSSLSPTSMAASLAAHRSRLSRSWASSQRSNHAVKAQ